jgi:hypothetical protein
VVVGAGSGWSGVRQSLLLRDELVYPYLLRLLLLACGVGCRPRLLRLPRVQLPLELLVWHARCGVIRRGGLVRITWRARAAEDQGAGLRGWRHRGLGGGGGITILRLKMYSTITCLSYSMPFSVTTGWTHACRERLHASISFMASPSRVRCIVPQP